MREIIKETIIVFIPIIILIISMILVGIVCDINIYKNRPQAYLVSYEYNYEYRLGVGNIELLLKPYTKIEEIRDLIELENDIDKVVITNIIKINPLR